MLESIRRLLNREEERGTQTEIDTPLLQRVELPDGRTAYVSTSTKGVRLYAALTEVDPDEFDVSGADRYQWLRAQIIDLDGNVVAVGLVTLPQQEEEE